MNYFFFSLATVTCDTETDGSNITRRSSSGGLLSPDVDIGGPNNVPEQDGFYLLKKDSQRRMTLSRILTQDEENICHEWLKCVRGDLGNTVLTVVSTSDIHHWHCCCYFSTNALKECWKTARNLNLNLHLRSRSTCV